MERGHLTRSINILLVKTAVDYALLLLLEPLGARHLGAVAGNPVLSRIHF